MATKSVAKKPAAKKAAAKKPVAKKPAVKSAAVKKAAPAKVATKAAAKKTTLLDQVKTSVAKKAPKSVPAQPIKTLVKKIGEVKKNLVTAVKKKIK